MPIKNVTFKAKQCKRCGNEFVPTNPKTLYCSAKCRHKWYSCAVCGREFQKVNNTTGKYCSRECWYTDFKSQNDATCPHCGKVFHKGQQSQKYCSPECKNDAQRIPRGTCEQCGKQLGKGSHPKQKFCSRHCALSGRDNKLAVNKNVGETANGPSGYRMVKVGIGHPGAFKSGWMLEHRYVMQEELGRPLLPTERVHHKNGIRHENNIENLELWTVQKKDPPGQRLVDLAKNFYTSLPDEDKEEFRLWLDNQ